LLHYICYIKFGNSIDAHGKEYKNLGRNYGYKENITKAVWEINLKEQEKLEKKQQKVSKLLKLSQSENIHEAQLALTKAKEILNQLPQFTQENDFFYIQSVSKFKRSSTKIKVISHILDTFQLRCVTNYGQEFAFLEVTGKKPHIDYAQYLYDYLDHQLDFLWKKERKNSKLSGITQKNSFLWGFLNGYQSSIKKIPKETKQLILRKKELDIAVNGFYRRVSSQQQKQNFSPEAHQKGVAAGSLFQIKKPISHQAKKELTYEGN